MDAPPLGQGYDLIGDIHGALSKLEGLLTNLDYRQDADGIYRHPEGRTVIFVGDLVDRHQGQREVLHIARAMIEAGVAQAVMGNHEFNAIAYATPDPDAPGEYLRPHIEKNTETHQSFLDAFTFGSAEYLETIEWFRTLPLWLDLGAFRVVHACWYLPSIKVLASAKDWQGRLRDEFLRAATTGPSQDPEGRGTPEFWAVEHVLKGPELRLTPEFYFQDPEHHQRKGARMRWWDTSATTWEELCEIPPGSTTLDGAPLPALPSELVPTERYERFRYDADAVPVFFGHYWRSIRDGAPAPLDTNTVCVDYSAGKDGPLVAYRWHAGDTRVHPEQFVHSDQTQG